MCITFKYFTKVDVCIEKKIDRTSEVVKVWRKGVVLRKCSAPNCEVQFDGSF